MEYRRRARNGRLVHSDFLCLRRLGGVVRKSATGILIQVVIQLRAGILARFLRIETIVIKRSRACLARARRVHQYRPADQMIRLKGCWIWLILPLTVI